MRVKNKNLITPELEDLFLNFAKFSKSFASPKSVEKAWEQWLELEYRAGYKDEHNEVDFEGVSEPAKRIMNIREMKKGREEKPQGDYAKKLIENLGGKISKGVDIGKAFREQGSPKKTFITPGVKIVQQERQRQIEEKGYMPKRDREYVKGELAKAACCYAYPNYTGDFEIQKALKWPWHIDSFNPSTDRVKDLAKAGALIISEIDREVGFELEEEKENPEPNSILNLEPFQDGHFQNQNKELLKAIAKVISEHKHTGDKVEVGMEITITQFNFFKTDKPEDEKPLFDKQKITLSGDQKELHVTRIDLYGLKLNP